MKVIELSVNQLLIKSSLASSSYLGQAICGLKKKKIQTWPRKVPKFNLNHLREISMVFNPLSANPTKWSNTLKQFVGKCIQGPRQSRQKAPSLKLDRVLNTPLTPCIFTEMKAFLFTLILNC